MFKEKLKDIKSLIIKQKEGTNKRKIENLVAFLILLIIVIVAINVILGTPSNEKNETNTADVYKQLAGTNNSVNTGTNTDYSAYSLEDNLSEILSNISGVGAVKVMITYSNSSEIVPMYNETHKESTTEEADTAGGTRTIQETDTSKEVIYTEEGSGKIPVTRTIIEPKVEGAIVIAEGAGNTNIKLNIIDAVSAVTGVASHKIQVFSMK
ncbi:MAG: hypothetical protein LBL91_04690 [Lachnospiraceae bacterium]|jgi:stage III sporulation protein AG|nr:hypothetical protein [Lachnospiraceae bacterium]